MSGKYHLNVAIFLTLFVSGSLCAQAPQLEQQRMNPAFVEWAAKQRDGLIPQNSVFFEGEALNRFGHVPSPIIPQKLSHPATEIEAMVKAGLTAFSAAFDLRTQGILSPVRNQNPFGTCWTFASLASLESNIRKTTAASNDFSEWHMAWFAYNPTGGFPAFTKGSVKQGEDATFDLGGNAHKALALMSRGTGPVSEASAPYQNTRNYPQSALPKGNEQTIATVKNAYLFDTSDQDAIKGLAQTYGAVAISMWWPDRPETESNYYNSTTKAFRYRQTGSDIEFNHAVNIVGWDDNFARTNFLENNQPQSNGAWIVRNSWGANWGDGGYFYISYDTQLGYAASYVGSAQLDSKTYQYDHLGLLSGLGYDGSSTAWFANVFTASGNDAITDVAFYTSTDDASYEIYLRTGVTTDPSTGERVLGPQTGNLSLPGYHRIKLASPVNVSGGQKFAVIVKLREKSGYRYPISVLYTYAGYTDSHTSLAGTSYASSNGTSWADIKTVAISGNTLNNVSVCLKAFAAPGANVPASIKIVDPALVVFTGETVAFKAEVGGLSNKSVAWTVSGGNNIDSQGVFKAPVTPQNVTITATSVSDASLKASVNVAIRECFDGNTSKSPQLLGFANAFGGSAQGGSQKYDLTGDGKIDHEDLLAFFKGLGW